MKRLAIFALFGALTTISFLPGQTAPLGAPEKRIAKADGSQDGKDHRQSQRDHQSAPEAVSYIQVSANKPDGLSDKSSNDLDIQRKVEWFTGVLAVVGVLQVAALIWQAVLFLRTLGAIRRQAGQVETQTGILEQSVTAAHDGLIFMRAKERARLTVTPLGFKPSRIVPFDFNDVIVEVTNSGPTSALNVAAWGGVGPPPPIEKALAGMQWTEKSGGLDIPSLVKPNSDAIPVRICFVDEHDLTVPDAAEKPADKFRMEVAGIVRYEDVFGDRHETRFRYTITPYRVDVETLRDDWKVWEIIGSSGWVQSGVEEDNRAT